MEKKLPLFWQSVRTNIRLKHQISKIEAFPRNGKIPLSLTQEKLYLIEQLKNDNSALNMGGSIRIQDSLNLSALEQTLTEIARRHEILRTVFMQVEQQPMQEIIPKLKVKLPVLDLQHLPATQREEEAKKLTKEFKNKPFDLTQILWRSQLIQLAKQDFIFSFVIHHLIWDAWSSSIFRQEFYLLYQAFSNNQSPSLPELSLQYADYCQWQRNSLQGDKLTQLKNYWEKQFDGNISGLVLPCDRPLSAITNNQGASESFHLSPVLTKALKQLSQQEGVSLFVTLFTVFNLLLNRYSGQEDLLVCSTVSGRSQRELKKLIGYFNNILVLRTQISEKSTFRQLLAQFSNTYLASLEYQDFPFHQLSEIPNLAHISLTRAMFSFVNIPVKKQDMEGLNILPLKDKQLTKQKETADFDIDISLREQNQQITGKIEYKTKLFESQTIIEFIKNFQTLLETITSNPDIYLGDLTKLKWNNDSIINYAGNQVKLEEIETILNQYEKIEKSLIIVSANQAQDKRLIAYIVPNQEQVPTKTELQAYLQANLPDYMIPSIFIPLEAFPLTPSGEVDFQALSEFDFHTHHNSNFVAPSNQTEATLAQIWREVLFLEQEISRDDNFFDLGGNSLLSVTLLVEIEKAFNKKIPLQALGKLNTITELAQILDQVKSAEETVESTTIVKQENSLNTEIYEKLLAYTAGWKGERINTNSLIFGHNLNGTKPPLFWILQGHRELSQLAKYIGEEQPVYGMRSGHLIMEYTPENTQTLAQYYAQEIIKIQCQEPYYIGGNCQSSYIATEIAKQIQKQGKKVALLLLLENIKYQPYQGKVVLIWGRNSEKLNPYRRYQNPELGWHKLYPTGYELFIISGDHGEYFNEPNIQDLASKINITLNNHENSNTNLKNNYLLSQENRRNILTEVGYKAEIKAPEFLTIKSQAKITILLTIKNISSETWQKTEQSAIRVANHWLDKNGEIVQWLDGNANLEIDLNPEEEIEINLTVTAPEKEGEYLLEIDLVEEGITWFKNKGANTASIKVKIEENQTTEISESINIEEYIKKGNIAYEKGDRQTSINYYQQVIKIQPEWEDKVVLNLGLALARNQEIGTAINYLEKALLLKQNQAQIYYELGKIYQEKQELDLALENYQLALENNYETSWLLYEKMGQILTEKGEIEQAIIAYEEGLKSKPDYVNIYGSLGNLKQQRGRITEAILLYEKAIELAPDYWELYLALGNAYIENEQIEKAEKSINQVLEINKNCSQAYLHLGRIKEHQGDLVEAKQNYQKAIELEETQEGAYWLLAQILIKENELELAKNLYKKLLEANPESYWGNRNLAEIYQGENKLGLAKEYLKKAEDIEPNNPYTYLSWGDIKLKERQILEAINCYQKARNLGIKDLEVAQRLSSYL